jgi:hypothetical protein
MYGVGVYCSNVPAEVLRAALTAAQGNSEPIDLLVENAQFFKTYSIAYHEGNQNPHLERISGQSDVLDVMLAPLSH